MWYSINDADYTFTVSGLDLADNKAADYAQDKFTVDLKNPEVKITGVKDKSANNGTVAPRISISDTNLYCKWRKDHTEGLSIKEKSRLILWQVSQAVQSA